MQYKGKLYGHFGGKKYFDTGKTAKDWDALEKRIADLEADNKVLRQPPVSTSSIGKEKTAIEKMIQWCMENAFNIEGQDGIKYVAIDYEEMRTNFDNWLKFEREQSKPQQPTELLKQADVSNSLPSVPCECGNNFNPYLDGGSCWDCGTGNVC